MKCKVLSYFIHVEYPERRIEVILGKQMARDYVDRFCSERSDFLKDFILGGKDSGLFMSDSADQSYLMCLPDEFDNTTVTVMHSDDGDTYLNDLMPLSTSVSIGKLTHRFRQASDAGRIQTSMTGQIGVKMDQVEYKFGGTIVPITDGGFDRNWREWNAQSSEGFDALIDDQRETVRALRGNLADQFLDGHKD